MTGTVPRACWSWPGSRARAPAPINFRDAYAEIALRQEDTFDSTIFNVWMNAWTEPDGTMIIGARTRRPATT